MRRSATIEQHHGTNAEELARPVGEGPILAAIKNEMILQIHRDVDAPRGKELDATTNIDPEPETCFMVGVFAQLLESQIESGPRVEKW
jgi:hypothetical protein